MMNIEKIKPSGVFTNYIYKAIPLAFDESMSYYETLCALLDYLKNSVTPAVNNNADAIIELQNYVTHYFDNLDVTEEINNKLDEMSEDGTLANIIVNYTPIPQMQQQIANNTQLINDVDDALSTEINNLYSQFNTQIIDANINIQENTQAIQENTSMINSLSHGTPIPVADISDMIDTDKAYLLTTTGHWYYYNVDTWTDGGVYQATAIADDSIVKTNLKENLQKNIMALEGTAGTITQTGTYYSGNVGSTAQSNASTGWSTGTLSVQENDIILVPFINTDVTYSTTPVILICDSSDVILEKYTRTDFIQTIDSQARPKPVFLKMPTNASVVRFNNCYNDSVFGSADTKSKLIPQKITKYNYNDERLESLYNGYETLSSSDLIEGKMYNMRLWDYSLGSFNTYVYDVTPLEYIHIKSVIGQALYLCTAIFTDNDGNITGCVGPFGKANENTNVDADYQVPNLSTKMYISQNKNIAVPEVSKKVVGSGTINNKKINAEYTNGVLTLQGQNQKIIFKNYGGNNLFMIYSYTNKAGTQILSTDMTPAPYIINAVNNGNGDRISEGFTGGNHQWNNQGSGSTATARQVSLNLIADNQTFSSGNVNCDKFTIIEKNRIQANNTCLQAGNGREVLEEIITFTYDGETLKVTNKITPLEDIIFKRYYGLQLANNNSYKFFADKVYDETTFSNITTIPYKIVGENNVSMKLNQIAGLGTYEYNTTSNKCTYYLTKAYYWLVNTTDQEFSSSDTLYFEGEYNFNDFSI